MVSALPPIQYGMVASGNCCVDTAQLNAVVLRSYRMAQIIYFLQNVVFTRLKPTRDVVFTRLKPTFDVVFTR